MDILNRLNGLGLTVKRLSYNKWARCGTLINPQKRNGWYSISNELVSYGAWDNSIEQGWFFIDEKTWNNKPTLEKIERYNQIKIENQKIAELAILRGLEEVTNTFDAITYKSQSHPYLVAKNATMQDNFKIDWHGNLVIPFWDMSRRLKGYQIIDKIGTKRFKAGSIIKNSFYPLNPTKLKLKDMDLVLLCEGYATASSIHQACNELLDSVNFMVICCFSSNNVDNVAYSLKMEVKNKNIIAIKDADSAGASVKTKGFIVGRYDKEDANDIHNLCGLEVLQKLIKINMERL